MQVMTASNRYGFEDLPGLMSLMAGDEKHDHAAASTLDVLWVLYDRVLRVRPETLGSASRDRFYLSKGHGPMAYYAVLAAKGFIGVGELPGYGTSGSALGWHPDRNVLPAAEISSGSLGHGLPLAVGTVLGLRAAGLTSPRVFVLVGDGELDEGSNHEAIAFAGRAGLGVDGDHRRAVVDVHDRGGHQDGPVDQRAAQPGQVPALPAHPVRGEPAGRVHHQLEARPADRVRHALEQLGTERL